MRIELKGFQEDAARRLASDMAVARGAYYRDGSPACCCLSAPTGSGKTVMAGAVIEGFLEGSEDLGIRRDPAATFLWVSDSPSLNQQTREKFEDGCDIDPQLYVTIGSDFTGPIEPNRVYFLNQQLLGRDKVLTRGGERRTFWSILDRAIDDPGIHLFMIADEAHRGFGSQAFTDDGDEDNRTIKDRLIDGHDLSEPRPMPVIVGISATPGTFLGMMQNRDRTMRPVVTVSPADVQASGLLVENIIVKVPNETAAVDNMYLKSACDGLKQSAAMWEHHERENPGEHVVPLMVVQVKNGVTAEGELLRLCRQISAHVGSLDPKTSFAHVFSSSGNISVGGYEIPRVEPEEVQRKEDIRVLFAKEAISTGWDCPRAEVLYSLRTHRDGTYIAQLIGRMVRTPLARQVDDMEALNSVWCYLPHFDVKTVREVVTILTTEDSEDFSGISEASGRHVMRDPVRAEWDDTLDGTSLAGAHADGWDDGLPGDAGGDTSPSAAHGHGAPDRVTDQPQAQRADGGAGTEHAEGTGVRAEVDAGLPTSVREAFGSIRMLARAQHGHLDWIQGGYALTSFLNDTGMSTSATGDLTKTLVATLETAIATYGDEFRTRRGNLSHIPSTELAFQFLNEDSLSENVVTNDADDFALQNVRVYANKVFGTEVTSSYAKRRTAEGRSLFDTNLDLAAAVMTKPVADAVRKRAETETRRLMSAYEGRIRRSQESVRQAYYIRMNRWGIAHPVYMSVPENMDQDRADCEEGYPKHILNDPSTHLAYLKLKDFESSVIRNEIRKPETVAWYRNPPSGSPERTLTIDFRGKGPGKSCHPDFIVFERVGDAIMPSVVDPHGEWLADSLDRLKGMVRHLSEYGDQYRRFWVITRLGGRTVYLDMKEQVVQDAVNASMDAKEIFRRYGKTYAIV